MEFRVQFFGSVDRLLYTDVLDAKELLDVLDWAREALRRASVSDTGTADIPVGYVILDDRGRQVARGYKREPTPVKR